jgi:hypothetical protein
LRNPYNKAKSWRRFVQHFDAPTVISILRGRLVHLDFEALIDQANASEPRLPAAYRKFLQDGTVPPLK